MSTEDRIEDLVRPDAHDPSETAHFDSLRAILLNEEWERIKSLEEAAVQLQTDLTAQQARADALLAELNKMRADMSAESEALIPRLIRRLGAIVTATIRDSRDEMAEALGPIMGDAIRVQIRDSRPEMVDTLYPIILETVQRAIAEFARSFQRNIDAQLRNTFGANGVRRLIWARLRGVSPADMALRDSFAFTIDEAFLIQHESGLLMAHVGQDEDTHDSDLVSGMLTAIRDFAQDSFGDDRSEGELNEIQYGDQHIIIESGQFAYLAVVITGIEPEGFRTRLRRFLMEMQIHQRNELRDYDGDPGSVVNVIAEVEMLPAALSVRPEAAPPEPMSRAQKWFLFGGVIVGVLLLALACFYLQFTIALLPIAFGETATHTPTLVPPTATAISAVIATATATIMPTNTLPPTATWTPPATATNTATAVATATVTATPRPGTPTATPLPPFTNVPVWVRAEPRLTAPIIASIPVSTDLTLIAQNGVWVLVRWDSATPINEGWLALRWVTLNRPIPTGIITSTPER